MKKATILFTCLTFTIMLNCGKARNGISYAYNLKEIISENYDTDQVKVNVSTNEDNETLNILIEDSKFNNYTYKKKQDMANEIGEIALELRKKEITGELTFIDKSNYGIVKTSKSDSYKIN